MNRIFIFCLLILMSVVGAQARGGFAFATMKPPAAWTGTATACNYNGGGGTAANGSACPTQGNQQGSSSVNPFMTSGLTDAPDPVVVDASEAHHIVTAWGLSQDPLGEASVCMWLEGNQTCLSQSQQSVNPQTGSQGWNFDIAMPSNTTNGATATMCAVFNPVNGQNRVWCQTIYYTYNRPQFYVDWVNGSDSNNGQSLGAAWKHIQCHLSASNSGCSTSSTSTYVKSGSSGDPGWCGVVNVVPYQQQANWYQEPNSAPNRQTVGCPITIQSSVPGTKFWYTTSSTGVQSSYYQALYLAANFEINKDVSVDWSGLDIIVQQNGNFGTTPTATTFSNCAIVDRWGAWGFNPQQGNPAGGGTHVFGASTGYDDGIETGSLTECQLSFPFSYGVHLYRNVTAVGSGVQVQLQDYRDSNTGVFNSTFTQPYVNFAIAYGVPSTLPFGTVTVASSAVVNNSTDTNCAGAAMTSTSSNSIATGLLTFITNESASTAGFVIGAGISAYNGSNYVAGTISSISSTTLVISVVTTSGSGSFSSWTFSYPACMKYQWVSANITSATYTGCCNANYFWEMCWYSGSAGYTGGRQPGPTGVDPGCSPWSANLNSPNYLTYQTENVTQLPKPFTACINEFVVTGSYTSGTTDPISGVNCQMPVANTDQAVVLYSTHPDALEWANNDFASRPSPDNLVVQNSVWSGADNIILGQSCGACGFPSGNPVITTTGTGFTVTPSIQACPGDMISIGAATSSSIGPQSHTIISVNNGSNITSTQPGSPYTHASSPSCPSGVTSGTLDQSFYAPSFPIGTQMFSQSLSAGSNGGQQTSLRSYIPYTNMSIAGQGYIIIALATNNGNNGPGAGFTIVQANACSATSASGSCSGSLVPVTFGGNAGMTCGGPGFSPFTVCYTDPINVTVDNTSNGILLLLKISGVTSNGVTNGWARGAANGESWSNTGNGYYSSGGDYGTGSTTSPNCPGGCSGSSPDNWVISGSEPIYAVYTQTQAAGAAPTTFNLSNAPFVLTKGASSVGIGSSVFGLSNIHGSLISEMTMAMSGWAFANDTFHGTPVSLATDASLGNASGNAGFLWADSLISAIISYHESSDALCVGQYSAPSQSNYYCYPNQFYGMSLNNNNFEYSGIFGQNGTNATPYFKDTSYLHNPNYSPVRSDGSACTYSSSWTCPITSTVIGTGTAPIMRFDRNGNPIGSQGLDAAHKHPLIGAVQP